MTQAQAAISEKMTKDHARIDALIAAYRRMRTGDSGLGRALAQASEALRRHISLEEEIIFPALAAHEGQEAAVAVDGMIQQHKEILRLLADAADCPPERPDERRNRDEAFVQALAEHNEGEERFVYSWLDDALSPEEVKAATARLGETTDAALDVWDISARLAALRAEPRWSHGDHTGVTLHKEPAMRIVLVALRAGAEVSEHAAARPITVQTVDGCIEFWTRERKVELGAGQVLALRAHERHSVRAPMEAAFLLTLAGEDAPPRR